MLPIVSTSRSTSEVLRQPDSMLSAVLKSTGVTMVTRFRTCRGASPSSRG